MRISQIRPPVVWVLKAKMRWVMPLRIIAQPKKRVMATPEMKGRSKAKSPAMMRKMLRAMDQLMALGARAERVDGAVLMRVLHKS
jgi:hypothetical protein